MYFYVLGHCWFKSISFPDDSKEFFCLKILVLFVLKALKLSSYFDLPTTNDEVIRSSDIYRQTFNIVALLCHLQNTYFLLVNKYTQADRYHRLISAYGMIFSSL